MKIEITDDDGNVVVYELPKDADRVTGWKSSVTLVDDSRTWNVPSDNFDVTEILFWVTKEILGVKL